MQFNANFTVVKIVFPKAAFKMTKAKSSVRMTFPIWQLFLGPALCLVYYSLMFTFIYQVATMTLMSVVVIGGIGMWFYKHYVDGSWEEKPLPREQTKHMNVCVIGTMPYIKKISIDGYTIFKDLDSPAFAWELS